MLFFLFFLSCIIVAKNVITDPFSVFAKTDYDAVKNKKYLPNERYIKMKYILNNKDKYDSFLIGSCTSNFINLDGIKGQKWYNLTFTTTSVSEMNRIFKQIIDNGIVPKRILMQVSQDYFKAGKNDYKKVCSKHINLCCYPLTRDEKISFWSRYLLYSPVINKDKNDVFTDGFKRNIFKGGSFIDGFPSDDTPKDNSDTVFDLEKYANKKPYDNDNLELIKEIVQICKEKNIDFEMLIIPEYIEIYKDIDLDGFNNLKRKLAEITPFYDFTGINKIASDKRYFKDPIHITSYASKLIVDRIFYQNKNDAPKIDGFGVYVTKNNIDSHIKNLENEIKKYKEKQ